jgi:hypothetical protein
MNDVKIYGGNARGRTCLSGYDTHDLIVIALLGAGCSIFDICNEPWIDGIRAGAARR